jgi:hypothetical protein
VRETEFGAFKGASLGTVGSLEGGSWDSIGGKRSRVLGFCCLFSVADSDLGDAGVDLDRRIGAFDTVITRRKRPGRRTGLDDVSEITGRVSVGSRATHDERHSNQTHWADDNRQGSRKSRRRCWARWDYGGSGSA